MTNALVIIPTYNERENIAMLIDAIFALPVAFHILIVDDGSPDGTAREVETHQVLYNAGEEKLHLIVRQGKQGLGTAYIAGFRFAIDRHYHYIMQMDADFSHNPEDLIALYARCAERDFDLSIGSRYVSGVNVVNWPMSRVLLSFMASKYVRFITGLPVHDTTAGFVCYRRQVLETLPLDKVRFMGYAFQIEMKFLVWKFGFKLYEVPIIFTDRIRGTSKMSVGIFKEAFLGVIQMVVQSWFKKYPSQVRDMPDDDELVPSE